MATNTLEAGLRLLGQQMATRSTIDHALELVMRKGNISRAEAFRHIWTLSRKTRKPLVAVAQALLEIGDDTRATD
jgi:AmiR/NasT family two-component response regulator